MEELKERPNNQTTKKPEISYKPLFDLMELKGLKRKDLIANEVHRNTVSKLNNNKNISITELSHLCKILGCQPSDIVEFVGEYKEIGKPIKRKKRKAETPKTEQTDTLTAPPDKYIAMLPLDYYEKSKKVGIADFDKFINDTIAVGLRRLDDTDKLTIIDRLIKKQKKITDEMRAEGKTQEEIEEALRPIREQMKAMQ